MAGLRLTTALLFESGVEDVKRRPLKYPPASCCLSKRESQDKKKSHIQKQIMAVVRLEVDSTVGGSVFRPRAQIGPSELQIMIGTPTMPGPRLTHH